MAQPADAISGLPRELAELITSRLPPSGVRCLFQSSSTFGQQPTQTLSTRLCLHVARLGKSSKVLSGRLNGLVHVKTLELSRAPATGHVTPPSCAQLSHTVTFLSRSTPSLSQLTCLDLTGLPLSFALAAAACLGTAAPATLTCLRITGCNDDLPPEDDGVADLWQGLAAVASLRRLELTICGRRGRGLPLAGLGALLQLHSLKIESTRIDLSFLPVLPGLTQLLLEGNIDVVDDGCPILGGFTALRDLRLARDIDDVCDKTLRGLTRLAVDCLPDTGPVYVASYAALVCLTAAKATFPCALLLQALHSVVELEVGTLVLPPVATAAAVAKGRAGVQSFTLGSVSACDLASPTGQGRARQQPQSMAHTFPRLAALRVAGDVPVPLELWPRGPMGHMLHLRTLSLGTFSSALLPLAGAVVAVGSLELQLEMSHVRMGACDLVALHAFAPLVQKVVVVGRYDVEGLIDVIKSWPYLAEVELRDSDKVSDLSLVMLARALRLRRVSLVKCPKVCAAGIAALASSPSVQLIRVRGCPLVAIKDVNTILRMVERPLLTIDLY